MKHLAAYIIAALLLCIVPASAQNYYLLQTVTGAGGGQSSSSDYAMGNTVGGFGNGSGSSPDYTVEGGFWGEYNALTDFYASSYAVLGGWNLISVARTVDDPRKSVVHPGSTSKAYAYHGSYFSSDTLRNGTGYWLKYGGSQLIDIAGASRLTDTIPVLQGWNIIGSITDAVATGSIGQIPPGIVTSQYFGYGGAYYTAASIEPGQGYWVKTNAGGSLVLNAPPGAVAATVRDPLPDELRDLNMLTVQPRDGAVNGQTQNLFFGIIEPARTTPDAYEMPPVAPGNGLDVRFGSNRFAELFSGGKKEVSIRIRANGTPLTLSWTVKETAGMSYVLVEKKGGDVTTEHKLRSGGSILLKDTERFTYTLRIEEVPTSFALEQNFPNPFNPTTVIRYQLPVNGHVTLKVFDMIGRETATLVDGDQEAGFRSVEWDATSFASGVYFYRLTATSQSTGKSFSDVLKLMLVK